MARALFDVNFLIALLDAGHVFHERAHQWWAAHAPEGWASCPLTENGVVRVMSQPVYSASLRFSVTQLVQTLSVFQKRTNHQFWPDKLSITDTAYRADFILNHRSITDAYLLGLAVGNQGTLVTFDQNIPTAAVPSAEPWNLTVV